MAAAWRWYSYFISYCTLHMLNSTYFMNEMIVGAQSDNRAKRCDIAESFINTFVFILNKTFFLSMVFIEFCRHSNRIAYSYSFSYFCVRLKASTEAEEITISNMNVKQSNKNDKWNNERLFWVRYYCVDRLKWKHEFYIIFFQ